MKKYKDWWKLGLAQAFQWFDDEEEWENIDEQLFALREGLA